VFACLQCGHRIPAAQISLAAPEPAVLAPAA
jgi:hypothetical protein